MTLSMYIGIGTNIGKRVIPPIEKYRGNDDMKLTGNTNNNNSNNNSDNTNNDSNSNSNSNSSSNNKSNNSNSSISPPPNSFEKMLLSSAREVLGVSIGVYVCCIDTFYNCVMYIVWSCTV